MGSDRKTFLGRCTLSDIERKNCALEAHAIKDSLDRNLRRTCPKSVHGRKCGWASRLYNGLWIPRKINCGKDWKAFRNLISISMKALERIPMSYG
jgi:hypothetical protein